MELCELINRLTKMENRNTTNIRVLLNHEAIKSIKVIPECDGTPAYINISTEDE